MKKHLFIAALAIAAAFASSCTKDNNNSIENSQLLGTWYMAGEYYHPAIVTFKENGEYEWEYGGITGIKDTGTYTFQDNKVTMTINSFWEIAVKRNDDGSPEYDGSWQKMDDTGDNSKTRTVDVYVLADHFTIWNVYNDWFFGSGSDGGLLLFMSDNQDEMHIDREVTQSDLQGEWYNADDNGNTIARLVLSGSSYTAWYLTTSYGDNNVITYYVSKETGTFSLNGTIITINHQKGYSSYSSTYNKETSTWEYKYSDYDPATLEADDWLTEYESGYSEEYYVYRDGANLYWGFGYMGYAWKKK